LDYLKYENIRPSVYQMCNNHRLGYISGGNIFRAAVEFCWLLKLSSI